MTDPDTLPPPSTPLVEEEASKLALTLSMVKFSHSVFALPFALMGAWLAAGGMPAPNVLAWIVVAAVSARTSAMAFNRLVDRDIDAQNPRTAVREIPRGALSARYAAGLVVVSAAVFVGAAWRLNSLSGKLAPLVLLVLLGYSLVKRFSAAVHFVLGVALGLAPLGAWIAVRGDFEGDLAIPLLLFLTVWTWVAGFDLIYSCQDADFDAGKGLHSLPAKIGVGRSLIVSRLLHVATVAALLALVVRADRGPVFLGAAVLAALLLLWEQSLVRADDLSRVNVAFFTVNGWVGIALFIGLVVDMAFTGGAEAASVAVGGL
ncbi:4-hydroxybenzoate octaprenyltransferase [Planctomycetes bacterium Poly30]|uniref:4-hydroxybenzoate polyprenyltransferase n=1 Tax=Saltatorellus ferox TaxID=2528018 RepID=A0A518ES32_9BACT|nr:4-hydroxybenzoate octaprenyltransferase [Planctomycetes bacterium Poly30]